MAAGNEEKENKFGMAKSPNDPRKKKECLFVWMNGWYRHLVEAPVGNDDI
jgi:hypothetical protein